MITNHAMSMVEKFRGLDTNVDISLSGNITYETPQIICIEYGLFGIIDGDRLNYSGINRKYITAMFDIERAKQITLSDIIDIEKLYRLMKQEGAIYRNMESNTVLERFQSMERVGWKPGAILDDLPMTNEEAICLLSQSLEQITLSDAADAFLYSHVPWMRGLLVSCYAKKLWNINY